MKTYWVKITAQIPYPKEIEFKENASSMGTAINRAIRKFRKELNGKRIKELFIRVIKI